MSRIKKTGLKVIWAATLLLAVLIITAGTAAAEGLELSTESKTGSVGGQAAIEITAENAIGTEGGQFSLSFDPGLVRPVSIEAGELITEADSNLYMANLEYAPGQLMFMWVTAYADTADSGTVCTIVFELLSEGETALEINDIVIAPEGFEIGQTAGGKITVVDNGADSEVDQEENDHNGPDREEEENETVDENQERVNAEDNGEDSLTEITGADNNRLLYIVLIIIAAAAAGGFIIFKRFKKPGV